MPNLFYDLPLDVQSIIYEKIQRELFKNLQRKLVVESREYYKRSYTDLDRKICKEENMEHWTGMISEKKPIMIDQRYTVDYYLRYEHGYDSDDEL
jgi:hypothetical protein